MMNWKRILFPTTRRLVLFGTFSVVALFFVYLTYMCWDGLDENGQFVGACEPVGGVLAWPAAVVAAYVAATLLTLRRNGQ